MNIDRRPPASSPAALTRMQRTRQRDTDPELALRSYLHASGFRFRVHVAIVPGAKRRADIAFPASKVAVFVDGCFWHFCPVHRTFPKANAAWWLQKLRTNRRRDLDTNRRLRKMGWHVERVWEHESPSEAATRIIAAVRRRARSQAAIKRQRHYPAAGRQRRA